MKQYKKTAFQLDKELIKSKIDCQKLAIDLDIEQVRGKQFRCFNKIAHNHGDKKPSMNINERHFFCHGCGVKGDCFNLVMEIKKITFNESIEFLADYLNIDTNINYNPLIPIKREYKKQNPDNVKQPYSLDYDTVSFYFDLTKIMKPKKHSENLKTWAMSRGMDYEHLLYHGVRDLQTYYGDIIQVINSYPKAITTKTGWRSSKETGYKIFYPLYMRSNGALIPQYLPNNQFPVSYRFRYYSPTSNKVQGMYGTLSSLPLGLSTVVQSNNKIVIITEGEPDYLSLNYLIKLHNYPIDVVGIVNFSYRPYQIINYQLKNKNHVFFMIHRDKSNPEKSDKLINEMITLFKKNNKLRTWDFRLDGSEDINDFLQKNQKYLLNKLNDILEVTK